MSCDAEIYRKEKEIEKPAGLWGVRHTQYLLLFTAAIIGYGIRTILNIGIYAMISDEPPNEDVPTYPEWASKKNTMISSFFWGYICFQIGAGQIAKNYGPKIFLGSAILIGSVFSILIPFFGAQFGYKGVIGCRVIQGMTQGFLFPSMHNLLSQWVPLENRARVATFTYAGSTLGTAIAMPITGHIASSRMGWPVAFYLYGCLGIIWAIFWFIFGSDSPAKHRSIGEEERNYITPKTSGNQEKKEIPTPWLSIFTSLPFWAVLISHCGQNWGFWTLMSEIPSYMKNILEYDIASNSDLSSLPYFTLWVLSLIMSPIADRLATKGTTSLATSRKIFNSIGFFVPASALICLSFVGSTQKTLTILVLVIAVGFNAAIYCGFNVNHIDLSPNHAGTLMGITNSISNIFSIVAPLAVDGLVYATGYQETEKNLWTIVFNIAAAIYIAVGVFFIFCGSGEVQPWNFSTEDKKEEKKDSKF